MRSKALIPDPAVITIERIVPDDSDIVLVARTRRCTVPCPLCGQPATRVHSGYTRSLRDLPWQGFIVRMELHTRRWFSDTPCCPRCIFTERFPTVAAPFGQRTARLSIVVLIFGFALGGAPGARVLVDLGILISSATLLRAVMATALSDASVPHCFRRGRLVPTQRAHLRDGPHRHGTASSPRSPAGARCRTARSVAGRSSRRRNHLPGSRRRVRGRRAARRTERCPGADRWHLPKNFGSWNGCCRGITRHSRRRRGRPRCQRSHRLRRTFHRTRVAPSRCSNPGETVTSCGSVSPPLLPRTRA